MKGGRKEMRENKENELKDEKAQENPEEWVEKDVMQDKKESQKRRALAEERFFCLQKILRFFCLPTLESSLEYK
jgi:hypothetical protein